MKFAGGGEDKIYIYSKIIPNFLYKDRSKKLKTEENSWHWNELNDAFGFIHWIFLAKLWLFLKVWKKNLFTQNHPSPDYSALNSNSMLAHTVLPLKCDEIKKYFFAIRRTLQKKINILTRVATSQKMNIFFLGRVAIPFVAK